VTMCNRQNALPFVALQLLYRHLLMMVAPSWTLRIAAQI
jgi:hypothetical protein